MLIRAIHLLPENDGLEFDPGIPGSRPPEIYLDVEADVEYEVDRWMLCSDCSSPAVYVDTETDVVEADIDGGVDHDTTCPKAALHRLRMQLWREKVAAGQEEINDM